MTSARTLVATSDTQSLLKALSATFTNTTTFIGELLQNARRAQATEIVVTIGDGIFEMADNGIGIADFNKLLSIAISGWGSDVQIADRPYGLGFLSVVYAAASIEVVSMGTRFAATKEQILGLEAVNLEVLDEPTVGTRIRMEGVGKTAQELLYALRSYAMGFPVRVIANGEEVERPHAEDIAVLEGTPYGKATHGAVIGDDIGAFYLQGLPIKVEGRRVYGLGVVHLDPLQYQGRLPDRNELCQADEAGKRFRAQWLHTAIATLKKLSTTKDEREFVSKYGNRLTRLNAINVLNEFDHVPQDWLFTYTEAPRRRDQSGESGTVCPESAVSREMIVAEGAYQINWSDSGASVHELLAEHVLFANNKHVVIRSPSGHWIDDELVVINVDQIQVVEGQVIASETTEIHYSDVEVILVKTLEAKLTTPVKGLPEITPIPFHYDEDTGKLLVSEAHADETYAIIHQVSNFVDGESEVWDEAAEQESASRVASTIRALRHNDPASLLDAVLRSGLPWRVPEMLKSNRFQVAFEPDGSFAVKVDPVE